MSTPESAMEQLRSLRIARGLTQQTLARRAGFSASEVSKWEREARPIKLWQYEVLVSTLGSQVVIYANEREGRR